MKTSKQEKDNITLSFLSMGSFLIGMGIPVFITHMNSWILMPITLGICTGIFIVIEGIRVWRLPTYEYEIESGYNRRTENQKAHDILVALRKNRHK